MAIRTTEEAVKELLDGYRSGKSFDPFIAPASGLVDGVEALSNTLDSDEQLDEERLELIERWLAAHFYCMFDPRAEREKAGSVEAKYETKIDLRLNLSKYGQMAMLLDTTGYLDSLNDGKKKRVLGVEWLGTEIEEV